MPISEEDNKLIVSNLGGGIKEYNNPLLHTSQFPMCGNAFRCDTYKGCSFGCEYCFANNRGSNHKFDTQIADVSKIAKLFKSAIEENDTSNIKKEMINHYVPIHLGGMADPFQHLEWKYRATYDFLKLTKKYNYPVNISTKVANLPNEYWDILDPSIHTFSLSIMGYSEEYIRLWEKNTPTALERINFAKQLKERGFWVSIRIQPIIDINEVLLLIGNSDFVDYFTVEHLKLPMDNKKMFEVLRNKLNIKTLLVPKGREWEFPSTLKIENINKIKQKTKTKIGCGDNDLHIMSDSLNCCGIDTMPPSFSNWLKYNSMYIKMTGDRDVWYPKNNCNGCFYSHCVKEGFKTMKEYTDRYYEEHYGSDEQLNLFDL